MPTFTRIVLTDVQRKETVEKAAEEGGIWKSELLSTWATAKFALKKLCTAAPSAGSATKCSVSFTLCTPCTTYCTADNRKWFGQPELSKRHEHCHFSIGGQIDKRLCHDYLKQQAGISGSLSGTRFPDRPSRTAVHRAEPKYALQQYDFVVEDNTCLWNVSMTDLIRHWEALPSAQRLHASCLRADPRTLGQAQDGKAETRSNLPFSSGVR
ncbi:hypothetical protein FI667_g9599, partial [Globisporangium splendens]